MSEDLPDRMPGARGGEDNSRSLDFIRVVLSSSSLLKSFAGKMPEYMPDRMSKYMSGRMVLWGSLEVSNFFFNDFIDY